VLAELPSAELPSVAHGAGGGAALVPLVPILVPSLVPLSALSASASDADAVADGAALLSVAP
jgi:hypothetical protein